MASHPLRPLAARSISAVRASPHPLRREMTGRIARGAGPVSDDSDLKLFVVSFTAFFVCFYTFFL
ncbi:hypothetical protein [Sphingomonas japonica]|uniref:Uncharacterized protein n=1 Tax=Sphingomonas japonica TaxID=511662 RepID=A0ABX0U016_9SPHN|nr:hypothetical protein [Sphingomonas japonica]NIJ22752.1 hypothetical protein [Sphingomonas japonica]